MNCPAKTDPIVGDGHNQNPDALCSDLTTRSDLGSMANARRQREHRLSSPESAADDGLIPQPPASDTDETMTAEPGDTVGGAEEEKNDANTPTGSPGGRPIATAGGMPFGKKWEAFPARIWKTMQTYLKFIGPGFMVSVAYIDPGNYATDVTAGASYRFKLLFMIFLSNIFAIFLQTLCIELGTVTGMDLAQMTRAHCPRWLNLVSWFFGEAAIIATDMAEVIGTSMAIFMLSDGRVPLVAGCAISIADVLFILIFYRQRTANMAAKRIFECFVALLVLGVVICFCIQLSYIQNVEVGDVFKGYLPSSALIQGQGLYQACGILGATVMPHSLYLGSGLPQDRLRAFDKDHNLLSEADVAAMTSDDPKDEIYRPSMKAIKSCLRYSIAENAISLFTFALFVNSAILIVAGASLYDLPQAANASLFGIYDLLSSSLAPAAGKLFAIALLLSGTSAGIVCTIASQMISEGQLRLPIKPWIRRLTIRSIAIVPSIVVAGALGKDGVDKALVGSQVALSVILPFSSAPLIWFTCFGKYMTVTSDRIHDMGTSSEDNDAGEDGGSGTRSINMRPHWIRAGFAVVIWGIIVFMNIALLVLLGMGTV